MPKNVKRGLILLLIAFWFTGCATPLAELREKPPNRIGHVEAKYMPLAICVTDALESSKGALLYRLRDRIPGQSASLTGSVVGLLLNPAPAVVLEITFTQETDQVVRIETRNSDGPGAWGWVGGKMGEEMWLYAERCAGKSIIISREK